jgi:hypothetical protein
VIAYAPRMMIVLTMVVSLRQSREGLFG